MASGYGRVHRRAVDRLEGHRAVMVRVQRLDAHRREPSRRPDDVRDGQAGRHDAPGSDHQESPSTDRATRVGDVVEAATSPAGPAARRGVPSPAAGSPRSRIPCDVHVRPSGEVHVEHGRTDLLTPDGAAEAFGPTMTVARQGPCRLRPNRPRAGPARTLSRCRTAADASALHPVRSTRASRMTPTSPRCSRRASAGQTNEVSGSAERTGERIADHWASADGGVPVVKAVAGGGDAGRDDGPVGATVDGGRDADDRAAPVGAAAPGDATGARVGATPQPASANTLRTTARRRRVLIGASDRRRDGAGDHRSAALGADVGVMRQGCASALRERRPAHLRPNIRSIRCAGTGSGRIGGSPPSGMKTTRMLGGKRPSRTGLIASTSSATAGVLELHPLSPAPRCPGVLPSAEVCSIAWVMVVGGDLAGHSLPRTPPRARR